MADRFVFCPAAATGCRLSLPGYMFFQSMTDLLLRM